MKIELPAAPDATVQDEPGEQFKLQRLREIVDAADCSLAEDKGVSFETEEELARFVDSL